VISHTLGRYLRERKINANIHVLSGIETHDPSVQGGKTFHALDFAATVIGITYYVAVKFSLWLIEYHVRKTYGVKGYNLMHSYPWR
jgi:hypothetical protein